MLAGAALACSVVDRVLDRGRWEAGLAIGAVAAALLWTVGALQKETSLAAFAFVPFAGLALRGQRARFVALDRRTRSWIVAVAAAMTLPLVPMFLRTASFVRSGNLFYGTELHGGGALVDRVWRQIELADNALGSEFVTVLLVAAAATAAAALLLAGVDWIVVGLLVAATATVIVSAETGIVTSRYDIPMLALLALVLARSACRVGRRTTLAVAVALAVVAVGQVSVGRTRVQDWARPRLCKRRSLGRLLPDGWPAAGSRRPGRGSSSSRHCPCWRSSSMSLRMVVVPGNTLSSSSMATATTPRPGRNDSILAPVVPRRRFYGSPGSRESFAARVRSSMVGPVAPQNAPA